MREPLENIRNALLCLKHLGFERLPIDIPEVLLLTREGILKKKKLEQLRAEIGDCHRCPLSKGRTYIVFGEGNPEAKLMFIGEAPGAEEDKQGRPFVGRAGQLLNSLIEKMGFRREDLYIANVVKCRPPNNRKPKDEEINSCIGFLKRQIEIISPKVIITLGDVATKALLPEAENITRARGRVYSYDGINLIPTYHPSYLLRNKSKKVETWKDAQLALKILKVTD